MISFWILTALNAVVVTNAAMCPYDDNTDEMRKVYLDYHNNKRLSLAKGKERDLNRTLGPAKNMHKLSWSCELEKAAKELAQGCGYDFTKYHWHGQNRKTFMGKYKQKDFDVNASIKEALDSWWGGVRNVSVNKENKYISSLYYFSNMAYHKNTEIGCSHVVCPNPTFAKLQVLCVYKRLGYMTNSIMWYDGKYCRASKDCTIFPNSTCEKGLCVIPKEVPDSGKSQICKSNNGITDAVRTAFLDRHNFYRSVVATGRAVDKIDKFAPKAASMPKLKYDCELEQSASLHAAKCEFKHTQGGKYGENLYMLYTPKYDKRIVADMASEAWFEELENNGVGKANIFSSELSSRPGAVGHYTQMVWQGTKYVGCGIQDCPKTTLIVCQYKDHGNVLGKKIYDTGEPCSKCPAGDTCNPTEGLCGGDC